MDASDVASDEWLAGYCAALEDAAKKCEERVEAYLNPAARVAVRDLAALIRAMETEGL